MGGWIALCGFRPACVWWVSLRAVRCFRIVYLTAMLLEKGGAVAMLALVHLVWTFAQLLRAVRQVGADPLLRMDG